VPPLKQNPGDATGDKNIPGKNVSGNNIPGKNPRQKYHVVSEKISQNNTVEKISPEEISKATGRNILMITYGKNIRGKLSKG
jgi:hypothetical protein